MNTKPIFNSYIAKQLVKSGNKIIDIQPDKNKDGSVFFIFETSEKFWNDLKKISHNN